ncbi:low molecular weight protein-tyrosine-phosphatase [[Clostridium] aminophilum]|uniref:protein-tyrosine-phosphatase n=1 Tax=[Clostridium] aminophilum TaxID=1526 RepID=A0A1I6IT27_9FIRM|nr:low molecular weight protein-tyrosine-phosphatase [[Clostridium] aminophilum]SFR69892.1 protein-tyrosine phosphatase [[Clostridium] aminophilum]
MNLKNEPLTPSRRTIHILFVCHGSICRSPMAKYVLQDMVEKRGLAHRYQIDCAAMTYEEIGNPVYPPVRQVLNQHGISCDGYAARHVREEDYTDFDYIIGMDAENMRDLARAFGNDPAGKCCRLLDFTDDPRDIADPWYTRRFNYCYEDVKRGCEELLRKTEGEN